MNVLHSYLSKSTVVDLSCEEQHFVDFQTDRMLKRKAARQRRKNPAQDWTASLPAMPRRGSAYAVYTAR